MIRKPVSLLISLDPAASWIAWTSGNVKGIAYISAYPLFLIQAYSEMWYHYFKNLFISIRNIEASVGVTKQTE